MGDAEEVADLFMRYPNGLTQSELKQYDEIFHEKFRAEVPSVGGLAQGSPEDKQRTSAAHLINESNFCNLARSLCLPLDSDTSRSFPALDVSAVTSFMEHSGLGNVAGPGGGWEGRVHDCSCSFS